MNLKLNSTSAPNANIHGDLIANQKVFNPARTCITMKIAIIDHNYDERKSRDDFRTLEGIRLLLGSHGIDTEIAVTLEAFEDAHGDLKEYDGILLHAGVQGQVPAQRNIQAKYPKIKIAVPTAAKDDYYCNEEIPCIGYRNYRMLYQFFGLAEQSEAVSQ